jgi:HEAT repeat protein
MVKMGFFGKVFKKSKTEKLIDDLWNDNEEIRRRAVLELGSMGALAIEPIIEALRRREGVKMTLGPQDALAEIGEPAVEPLIKMLKEIKIGSPKEIKSTLLTSTVAAFALAKMSDGAGESLIKILEDKAVEPLIQTARTEAIVKGNKFKFVAVCAALGNIGDKRAIEPLKSTIESWEGDKVMQEKAMEAIEKIQGKTSEIVRELRTLKFKISELPQKYPTEAFTVGPGVAQAQEQIPIICAVIDDAVKALEKGLDVHDRPITRPQIADGLKRLVTATRKPAFISLILAVLSLDGISELEKHMNEIEQLASKIK